MAMQHLAGRGKLFRPLLVLGTYQAVSNKGADTFTAQAAALELIHIFTLIHDDLPALDDAKLRRGLPSVHIAHGEALAVLAGDGLLSLALKEMSASDAELTPSQQAELLEVLTQAVHAVIEGEMLDLQAEGQRLSLSEIEHLHRLKTGALLGACCETGAILAGANTALKPALREYGITLGLAFQIRDDLLSVEGTEEAMGKTLSTDQAKGKSTYARLLGYAGAKAELDKSLARIDALVAGMELRQPVLLREIADWACRRAV
jgi:geranylgeranyl pyrophosphate synthase